MTDLAAELRAWHFTAATSLANGDKRAIKLGETLSVEGEIVPCEHGLHASVSAYDALQYAPGPILWRVELSGTVVAHGDPVDKYAASQRTAIAGGIDVSPALREYARWCALQVIHLWDAPAVVREYLETGNGSLRTAAWTAAWTAASAAAWTAAWTAARAAAWTAAWAAVSAAAWTAARATARAAARAAASAAQRARFEELCLQLVGETTP